ncbi:MAG TPA: hypothetical protein VKR53_09890 [Puia sp.]|nr:hypothetical protein [Puia sp.]
MRKINRLALPIFLLTIIFCCISKNGFSQSKTSDSTKKSKTNWTWKGKPVTEKQLEDSMGVSFKKFNDSINRADHLKPIKLKVSSDSSK